MERQRQSSRSGIKGIYGAFSSLKMTVTLCLLLAIVSLAGTLIKQNASPEEYLHLYGPGLTKFFRAIGLFDLYHSKGFTILLLLLAANLLFCSGKNLPRIWKLSFGPRKVPSRKALAARRLSMKIESSMPPPVLEQKVASMLESTLGRVEVLTGQEGKALHWRKGSYSRLGPYITHGGVLLILLGAVVGGVFGFKGYVNIPEGEEVSSVVLYGTGDRLPLGFEVRCERFLVEHYENGTPKEYRSELVIREEGREVMKRAVRVNHPLSYRGMRFYQASYGQDARAEVDIRVKGKEQGNGDVMTARVGQEIELPAYKSRVRLLRYVPDLSMPAMGSRGMPKSLGPAVQVIVFQEEGHTRPYWLLQRYPDFRPGGERPFSLVLERVRTRYYTGLQVTKDPGSPIVWIGCTLMILGLIVAFFTSERQVWVLIRDLKGGSSVTIAGWANKNPEAFERVFEKTAAAIRKALAPTT